MNIYAGKFPLKTFFWNNTKYRLVKVEQHKHSADKPVFVLRVVKQDN